MKSFFLLQVLPVDSVQTSEVENALASMTGPLLPPGVDWSSLLHEWSRDVFYFSIRVVLCVVLFFVGRSVINMLTKYLRKALTRRKFDGVAVSLLDSLFVAILYVVLAIVIAMALGVKSVSFAALLASLGLAIGMALSGQLQNLAGGVIILLTKPFKIGDFIQAQGEGGVVDCVSLFHTKVLTPENKTIFIPNGILSSGVITNVTHADVRRVDWVFGVQYNEDFDRVRTLLLDLLSRDERIKAEPKPFVALKALGASSVDVVVRAWAASDLYWDVYFDFNRTVYTEFNKVGISFPYPHLTIDGGITTIAR